MDGIINSICPPTVVAKKSDRSQNTFQHIHKKDKAAYSIGVSTICTGVCYFNKLSQQHQMGFLYLEQSFCHHLTVVEGLRNQTTVQQPACI